MRWIKSEKSCDRSIYLRLKLLAILERFRRRCPVFLRGRGLNYRRFEQVCVYLGYSKETSKEKFTAINNMSGQRIGSWLLLEKKSIDHKIAYLCRCECGTERVVPLTRLNSGCSKSCGCKRLEHRTEGQEKGYELGKKVTNALHTAGLSAAYETKVANKNSRSGIRGVCPWGGKWRASITAAGGISVRF